MQTRISKAFATVCCTIKRSSMKRINKDVLIQAAKVVLAAVAAICFAEVLRLKYAVSAGIVAILSIQPTKTETVKTALGRFYAFISALIIAGISFGVLGVHLNAFFLFLAGYILVCQIFGWHAAMAMNSVLISHFVSEGAMTFPTIMNEILIFLIGVIAGIIANLHLHKKERYIWELEQNADEQIVKILGRMSERIVNMDLADYDGECFVVLQKMIRKAKDTAELNYKNQFRKDDTFDMDYLKMREDQCEVLYEMYKSAKALCSSPATAKKISDFMALMAKVYARENDGTMLMKLFQEMDKDMKSQPLPVTREEFEDRARLFTLMRYIEEFLQIKIDFAKKYGKLEEVG